MIRDTVKHVALRIQEGMLQDMFRQTKWIYQYARRYWLAIIIYTLIGLLSTSSPDTRQAPLCRLSAP